MIWKEEKEEEKEKEKERKEGENMGAPRKPKYYLLKMDKDDYNNLWKLAKSKRMTLKSYILWKCEVWDTKNKD